MEIVCPVSNQAGRPAIPRAARIDRMEYHFPSARGQKEVRRYEVSWLREGEAVLWAKTRWELGEYERLRWLRAQG